MARLIPSLFKFVCSILSKNCSSWFTLLSKFVVAGSVYKIAAKHVSGQIFRVLRFFFFSFSSSIIEKSKLTSCKVSCVGHSADDDVARTLALQPYEAMCPDLAIKPNKASNKALGWS